MADRTEEQFTALNAAARAGRVAFSDFLEPAQADALVARLKATGAGVEAWGGYPGARRRVVAAYPPEVPSATPNLTAWYVAGAPSAADLRAELTRAGIDPGRLGDDVAHQDGITVVTFAPLPPELQRLTHVAGRPVEGAEVPLERLGGGAARQISAVVPSLRVDVLGARAFGVSRAYFAKGVAAGRVSVNGVTAGKSASAELGDQVYAAGLGRFHVQSVEGETRRGNLKVTLTVEKG